MYSVKKKGNKSKKTFIHKLQAMYYLFRAWNIFNTFNSTYFYKTLNQMVVCNFKGQS